MNKPDVIAAAEPPLDCRVGRCCYGGVKPKSACASCAAWLAVDQFDWICDKMAGTWRENLPQPQTDVDRTVLRRLTQRWKELGAMNLREQAPEIAYKMSDIAATMERLGIGRPFPKM